MQFLIPYPFDIKIVEQKYNSLLKLRLKLLREGSLEHFIEHAVAIDTVISNVELAIFDCLCDHKSHEIYSLLTTCKKVLIEIKEYFLKKCENNENNETNETKNQVSSKNTPRNHESKIVNPVVPKRKRNEKKTCFYGCPNKCKLDHDDSLPCEKCPEFCSNCKRHFCMNCTFDLKKHIC